MQVELTKEEIEAINIDVAHILDKISLSENHKELRLSLLEKLKPELTREEITSNWVKENNIVVGSKVKVAKKSNNYGIWVDGMDKTIGKVGKVIHIGDRSIMVDIQNMYYEIESLEPYKEEWVRFTFEDRELFRNKWVKFKKGTQEFIATAIDITEISFGDYIATYEEAFEKFNFIDGTPFGKLK